jgi:hypothetical protein
MLAQLMKPSHARTPSKALENVLWTEHYTPLPPGTKDFYDRSTLHMGIYTVPITLPDNPELVAVIEALSLKYTHVNRRAAKNMALDHAILKAWINAFPASRVLPDIPVDDRAIGLA